MLYIFGKLGTSSKQWFILYFISSNQENALRVKHKLISKSLSDLVLAVKHKCLSISLIWVIVSHK